MEISPLGWAAIAVPLASSAIFFALGKGLPLARRIFAAVHGVAAVAVLPVAIFVAAAYPDIGETGGTGVLVLIGGVASTSVFYAIAAVRSRWYYHLLHIPTFAVIAGGFILGMFLFSGR